MTNTDLWDRVCRTDPKHVKPITGKQYSGNSPKPYYIVRRLTEEFGPCGTGWGFDILNERFERLSDHDVLHVAKVEFWYGADRKSFQQMGQTKAAYMTSKGTLLVDEDAPKKSVTDALVKCASYLGFAGDIFMGAWDDSKYVNELRKEFAEGDKAPVSAKGDGLEEKLRASIEQIEQQGGPLSDARYLGLTIERAKVIRKAAGEAVAKYNIADEWGCYEAVSWIDDPTEREALWKALSEHSDVRACIKRMERAELEGEPKPRPVVEKVAPMPGLKKIGVRATTEEASHGV